MLNSSQKLIVGTRTSPLALWQSEHVCQRLQEAWPHLTCQLQDFVTSGDKTLDKPLPAIGGKGLFTAELEAALQAGTIDIAVHSLKDLPTANASGLVLGAITERADVRDALLTRPGQTLATLPHGAIVGTSSLRRQAQLLALRPDLVLRSIRGNVDTRIRKLQSGEYDAIILAAAGLERLGRTAVITQYLPLETMLPAPGQAALAVQCRADDTATLALLTAIDHAPTRTAVTAERTFLQSLGGGCSAPIAAYAHWQGDTLNLTGLVASADGRSQIRLHAQHTDPTLLGQHLAHQALAQGASTLLSPSPLSTLHSPLSTIPSKRLLLTRPVSSSLSTTQRFVAHYPLSTIHAPVIAIRPLPDLSRLDHAIHQLTSYDWLIFTSSNAVEIFAQHANTPPTSRPKIAAVGPATAQTLQAHGYTPNLMPAEFIAPAIATALGDVAGQKILLPRAQIARPDLPDLLRAQGAEVDDIPIYDTVPVPLTAEAIQEISQGVDIITFASSSAVQAFCQAFANAFGQPLMSRFPHVIIACIGPATAQTAVDFGLPVHVVATEHTMEGLIQTIVEYFEKRGEKREEG